MWEGHLAEAPENMIETLGFMTTEHHRVRYYAVDELVRGGVPLPVEKIALALELPLGRVRSILEDLENNLFFVVRDGDGDVIWAFPVTVEPTPHRITFDTGERLYGA